MSQRSCSSSNNLVPGAFLGGLFSAEKGPGKEVAFASDIRPTPVKITGRVHIMSQLPEEADEYNIRYALPFWTTKMHLTL